MTRFYYRSAKAALICFDITNKKTFKKLKYWVNELQTNEPSCQIYIVATKCDLETSEIDMTEVQSYALKINAKVFETSSKTGLGIRETFETVAKDYIESKAQKRISVSLSPKSNSQTVILQPVPPPTVTKCKC